MLPRYARLVLVASALILAGSTTLAAEAYKPDANHQRQGDFRVTGAARQIDRAAEIFDLTDRDDTFTILADRATVQLSNGKFGTIRDLKDTAQVHVMGDRLSSRTVLASTVIVIDDSGSYGDSAKEGYRSGDRVETDGYVMRVETRASEIDIRTRAGSYVVVVRPDTVIRRYLYVTDISDVNDGDNIKLTGTVDREGKIVAERIQVSAANSAERGKYPVGKGYRPPSKSAAPERAKDTIEGTVVYPVSAFDRTLGLDTRYGERKVDVSKDAEVLVKGKAGSVHGIAKGDGIRVVGEWVGSTMVASRLETADQIAALPRSEETTPPAPLPPLELPPVANPPAADPPAAAVPVSGTLTGRIVAIDYTKLEMTIDAAMKDQKIDARDASVTLKGSTRRFSELKKGDKVEVKGEWEGDVLKAAMVDVVE